MDSVSTAAEQAKEQLSEYGYTPDSLDGMQLQELQRLHQLHKEFDQVEFNLKWYQGTGPCYEMLHDLLTDVPLAEARRQLRKLARQGNP